MLRDPARVTKDGTGGDNVYDANLVFVTVSKQKNSFLGSKKTVFSDQNFFWGETSEFAFFNRLGFTELKTLSRISIWNLLKKAIGVLYVSKVV